MVFQQKTLDSKLLFVYFNHIINVKKNDTLATLRELEVIENNHQMKKFLPPHIPRIRATPIIEKSTTVETLSFTVEDEIDCFVTSDVGNYNNDCSGTLDLIDSACKNIKYKKLKIS